ncbi:hypothetical protein Neosp_003368 [[Neocosmospora] mangrovei]
MPLLHKTAASLLSCLPKPPSRRQKSHSAAAVDDDPKSKSSSASSSRSSSPTPPEEIELDVLTSKPAPPPTRPRLNSILSNSTKSSESSISESGGSDIFTDSSGLTLEERRKLVEEILKELEAL